MRYLLMVLAVLVLASIGFGYTNLQYCDTEDTFPGYSQPPDTPIATRFILNDPWPGIGTIGSAYLEKIWFRFNTTGPITYEIWEGHWVYPCQQIGETYTTYISQTNTWVSSSLPGFPTHLFTPPEAPDWDTGTIWVVVYLGEGLEISQDSDGNFTGQPRSHYYGGTWWGETNDFAMKIEVDIASFNLDQTSWGSIKASF